MIDVREAITRAHHEEWAWAVAALTRRFGDLDIAEEAAAEAFATAVDRHDEGVGGEGPVHSARLESNYLAPGDAVLTNTLGPPWVQRN